MTRVVFSCVSKDSSSIHILSIYNNWASQIHTDVQMVLKKDFISQDISPRLKISTNCLSKSAEISGDCWTITVETKEAFNGYEVFGEITVIQHMSNSTVQ